MKKQKYTVWYCPTNSVCSNRYLPTADGSGAVVLEYAKGFSLKGRSAWDCVSSASLDGPRPLRFGDIVQSQLDFLFYIENNFVFLDKRSVNSFDVPCVSFELV